MLGKGVSGVSVVPRGSQPVYLAARVPAHTNSARSHQSFGLHIRIRPKCAVLGRSRDTSVAAPSG